MGDSGPRNRGRRAAAVLAGAGMVAGVAACSGQQAVTGQGAVSLAVSPGGGAALPPDSPIDVRAKTGRIANVTVTTAKGAPVEGDLSADRTQWRSRWALTPGQSYAVDATAVGKDGKTRTVRSGFTVATVQKKYGITVDAPFNKETVGVGIPIVMRFDSPVKDKAAVERALEVRSDKPVEGAWHWLGNQEVVFRTKTYWPAHTKASFVAHLSGVNNGKGMYGGKDYAVNFTVGDSHVSTAGEDSHKMVVKINGKKARTIPTSMGRGGEEKYTTTNGVHLTMQKDDPVTMTSDWEGCGQGCAGYYSLTVYKAVKISDSGEYVHSAPWSVGDQGHDNVSHGCINVSPSDAAWFYKLAQRGDVVTVTGTSRPLAPDNGWGFWQMGWNDWVKGSALKRSVSTAPHADAATLSAQSGQGAAQQPRASHN
ncbi:Ig-like domain-containing protein [Actinomadura nitritigenes]|uniref:L,D-transpeptidase n=1 Tax=Actinomadura nitritigenes TaxID=134602 RepID=UPI003D8A4190